MPDSPRALEQQPICRLLVRYSLPAIAAMLVFSLYNIVDSIFIGHWVGALALSGLAIAFPIMNLTIAFGTLLGIGGASICSIRLGQKDMSGAEQVFGNVVVLNIITGGIFALVSLTFLDPVLIIFGAGPDVLGHASAFMRIILLGLPISYTLFNLNHIMRASGYPNKAMLSMVLTVLINAALAPLFIYVLGWGMQGAALATILAQAVGMIWVLHHFCDSRSHIHFRSGICTLRWAIVRSITSIGLSPFCIQVCACAVVALINLGLRAHGGDLAIGAYGIINRVLVLFVMIVVGLSQGMQPIVGYNYGAKHLDRVRRTLLYGVVGGTAVTTCGFLLGMFMPEAVSALFTPDEDLIALSASGLRACTLAFALVGGQIVLINFFQSLGRAKLSIFLSLTRQLIFLIPCLLLLPRFWGLEGIWYSLPLSDLLALITCIVVFLLFRREWRAQNPSHV